VDVHGFSDQIYNPVFLNSPLLVSSQLIARVIGERGVGDFNDKIDLSRRGMFLHPSLVKNDIWLGFVEMLDANRPSGAHSVAIFSLVAEDFGKGVDQVLVVISDGSHAKDLAIKEFDSFFWPENAGLRHPVILVDRKLPDSGFDGFGEKGLHRWLFNCAAGDGRNPVQKREMSATVVLQLWNRRSHAVGKKIVGDEIAPFDPLLQLAKVHRHRCEFLCDRVVQFPRDAAVGLRGSLSLLTARDASSKPNVQR